MTNSPTLSQVSPSAKAKRVFVSSPHEATPSLGPQGQRLLPTVTNPQCGTTRLSAGVVYMPPGRISRPHVHRESDIIVVVIEGFAATLIGPDLRPELHGPGDFIFIPEGTIHSAVNLNGTHRLIAIETRTDPAFNADVEVVPEYDDRAEAIAAELQLKFSSKTLDTPRHWSTQGTHTFCFTEAAETDPQLATSTIMPIATPLSTSSPIA